jgi:ABC-2 type transport system permease protein
MPLLARSTGGYRYGGVLLLTLAVAVFALLAPEGRAARTIELLAAGATLLVAVLTSKAPAATRRAAAIGLAIVVAVAGTAAALGHDNVAFTFALIALLAIVTIGIILRFGQSAEIVAWAMAFAFQPFAAVFYPVAILPAAMRAVARVVPASYVFEGMRAVLAGHGVAWGQLGVAAALDALYAAGAVWFFARMLARVRAGGGLARFGE